MVDGAHRESRYQVNVPMEEFSNYVTACIRKQVLIPILLLRHAEGANHFQALRFEDLKYECYLKSETSQTKPCMRGRLDEVNAARDLPKVDATSRYVFADADPVDAVDGIPDAPRQKVKPQVVSTTSSPSARAAAHTSVVRVKLQRTEAITYDSVLTLRGDIGKGTVADRKKHSGMVRANKQAVAAWRVPLTKAGVLIAPTSIETLATVDVTNGPLFRHCLDLFYQLPHAALAAQQLGPKVLCMWGVRLAEQAQLRILQSVIDDAEQPREAQEWAIEWVSAVTTCADAILRKRLINVLSRWKRMKKLEAVFEPGCKPVSMLVPEWELSNVLSYLLWNWRPNELDCVAPEVGWVSIGAIKQQFYDNDHAESAMARILATNNWSGMRSAVLQPSTDSYPSGLPNDESNPLAGFSLSYSS